MTTVLEWTVKNTNKSKYICTLKMILCNSAEDKKKTKNKGKQPILKHSTQLKKLTKTI